jgi:hypothetical protein
MDVGQCPFDNNIGENDPNSPDYEELFFKSPDCLMIKFQQVAKNIKGFCFFFFFSYFHNYYITKFG